MATIIRTWRLPNGLTVEVEDNSVNYYADYYHIKLVVRCRIAVRAAYMKTLEGSPSYGRVVETMGRSVDYYREIVRAGVAGRDVASVKGTLLQAFVETALPYFGREDFGEKFVRKRFAEVEKDLIDKDRYEKGSGD